MLVALLCEAELRFQGLSVAGVTWGGNQNAADGGLDVRVELSEQPRRDGFIPRAVTGFQVKKPDMPRGKILAEMTPDGVLRPVIRNLAKSGGAYIIVSGTGSTSDSVLQNRRDAMLEAVNDFERSSSLRLDFFDRERIAGWVRSHPSLGIWVREKIGNPVAGWQPYRNWANPTSDLKEKYLLDDHVRILDSGDAGSEERSAICGINRIRESLSQPGSSIRLVGLSGVGKTRLLQALFDERIGVNALNPAQVFYTDVADSPSPDPRTVADHLIASRTPAILAIDNCPPDLHRRLTSVCIAAGSSVSVITVEYDVSDDQPEETTVFRLEPASVQLVEKIVRVRFAEISQVDAGSIAEFSGGNARIAIALANTVRRGETLSGLRDDDLFRRLFFQRHATDNALYRAAEACSLVYSFDGENTKDSKSELNIIGSLVDQGGSELFGHVAELRRRDLVQKRNIWRAVLPHALANRLAQRALEDLPRDKIVEALADGRSKRLLQSFSRRLGFLHECGVAVEIVEGWLSSNGMLGDVQNLDDLGLAVLKNVSSVAPLATLKATERAANGKDGKKFTSRANGNYLVFTRLLRSLAYDPELFERCAGLLIRFALSEAPDERTNSTRDLLASLFFIHLSGTHASAVQRAAVIARLIESMDDEEQVLGLRLLGAALEAWHFNSSYEFSFGARPRDFGYAPETKQDVEHWYEPFLRLAEGLAVSTNSIAADARELLAQKLRGLWIKAHMFDELERLARAIVDVRPWNEGWIAVRTTLRFDSKNMDDQLVSRLKNLEKLLAPGDLLEKARAYALTGRGSSLDLLDAEADMGGSASDRYARAGEITRAIGAQVAKDQTTFNTLLPEMVLGRENRMWSLGQGLADGAQNAEEMWRNLRSAMESADADKRNSLVIRGFINGLSQKDPDLTNRVLDSAIEDEVFCTEFPTLQAAVTVDATGVQRLLRSLSLGAAPIWTYHILGLSRTHESIDNKALCELLRAIASKCGGVEVALDVLHMRFYCDSDVGRPHDAELVSLGRELLSAFEFWKKTKRIDVSDYHLKQLARICFEGESAGQAATAFCRNLFTAFSENRIYSVEYPQLLATLATLQPAAVLDELLNNEKLPSHVHPWIFGDIIDNEEADPLSNIRDQIIVEWCEVNPVVRYPLIAAAVRPFKASQKDDALEWTSLALSIIENSPDAVAVLSKLKKSLAPRSWSGSRADIMEKRAVLIGDLTRHRNPVVSEWANREEQKFREDIRSEREWEEKQNRSTDERFE